jgi:hypothetical protein
MVASGARHTGVIGAATEVSTRCSWNGWRRAGRPDEPERLQASLRGCNAERRRSAGLLGDRTHSYGLRPNNLLLIHPGMNRAARRDTALSRWSVAGSPFQ